MTDLSHLTPEDQHILKVVEENAGVTPGAKRLFHRYTRGAAVGFVLLALGLVGGNLADNSRSDESREAIVKSGRVVSVTGCNRDYKLTDKLRTIISRSDGQIKQLEKDGNFTHEQVQRALDQNHKSLKDIQLPDCRVAGKVLTDDPTDIDGVPIPLHPPQKKDSSQ